LSERHGRIVAKARQSGYLLSGKLAKPTVALDAMQR
jgi:hypothetical protein